VCGGVGGGGGLSSTKRPSNAAAVVANSPPSLSFIFMIATAVAFFLSFLRHSPRRLDKMWLPKSDYYRCTQHNTPHNTIHTIRLSPTRDASNRKLLLGHKVDTEGESVKTWQTNRHAGRSVVPSSEPTVSPPNQRLIHPGGVSRRDLGERQSV
jgi:hypothetical protein